MNSQDISGNPATAFINNYKKRLINLLEGADYTAQFSNLITLFNKARHSGNKIIVIGNGGSSQTAVHFANDLTACTPLHTPSFFAYALTNNMATVTAIANDVDFQSVFAFQIQRLINPADVLVAFSASGESKNIIQAIEYAKNQKANIVSFTGFNGGRVKELSDICFHVPSSVGDYAATEDIHFSIAHQITTYFSVHYE